MAAARKIKRSRQDTSVKTEFKVPLARALTDLLDPDQVQEGDLWTFVDNSTDGLIIVRNRQTSKEFDENGDEIPAEEAQRGKNV